MNSLSNRLSIHFAAVAAMTAGAACVNQHADAAVVYSGIVNIAVPSTVAGMYLNVATGTYSTIAASIPGWDVNPWGSSQLSMYSPAAIPSGAYVGFGTQYTNLPSNTLIDINSTFASGLSVNSDGTLALNSPNNLIGFRFLNEITGLYHFGWMRIALSATSASQPRSIVDYAWETNGGILTPFTDGDEPQGILAGDTGIPAPGSLPVLALAAFGRGRRRR